MRAHGQGWDPGGESRLIRRTTAWLPFAMILVLAGIGLAIGLQKHLAWLAILLALLGAALAWLLWVMIRVAIFTTLGAIAGAVVMGLMRSHLWFVGALVGACLGFFAGWQLHRRRVKSGP